LPFYEALEPSAYAVSGRACGGHFVKVCFSFEIDVSTIKVEFKNLNINKEWFL
jgi:hypothetical protein